MTYDKNENYFHREDRHLHRGWMQYWDDRKLSRYRQKHKHESGRGTNRIKRSKSSVIGYTVPSTITTDKEKRHTKYKRRSHSRPRSPSCTPDKPHRRLTCRNEVLGSTKSEQSRLQVNSLIKKNDRAEKSRLLSREKKGRHRTLENLYKKDRVRKSKQGSSKLSPIPKYRTLHANDIYRERQFQDATKRNRRGPTERLADLRFHIEAAKCVMYSPFTRGRPRSSSKMEETTRRKRKMVHRSCDDELSFKRKSEVYIPESNYKNTYRPKSMNHQNENYPISSDKAVNYDKVNESFNRDSRNKNHKDELELKISELCLPNQDDSLKICAMENDKTPYSRDAQVLLKEENKPDKVKEALKEQNIKDVDTSAIKDLSISQTAQKERLDHQPDYSLIQNLEKFIINTTFKLGDITSNTAPLNCDTLVTNLSEKRDTIMLNDEASMPQPITLKKWGQKLAEKKVSFTEETVEENNLEQAPEQEDKNKERVKKLEDEDSLLCDKDYSKEISKWTIKESDTLAVKKCKLKCTISKLKEEKIVLERKEVLLCRKMISLLEDKAALFPELEIRIPNFKSMLVRSRGTQKNCFAESSSSDHSSSLPVLYQVRLTEHEKRAAKDTEKELEKEANVFVKTQDVKFNERLQEIYEKEWEGFNSRLQDARDLELQYKRQEFWVRIKRCFCGKLGLLRTCQRCLSVFYCSKHCQSTDWPFHSSICKTP